MKWSEHTPDAMGYWLRARDSFGPRIAPDITGVCLHRVRDSDGTLLINWYDGGRDLLPLDDKRLSRWRWFGPIPAPAGGGET